MFLSSESRYKEQQHTLDLFSLFGAGEIFRCLLFVIKHQINICSFFYSISVLQAAKSLIHVEKMKDVQTLARVQGLDAFRQQVCFSLFNT